MPSTAADSSWYSEHMRSPAALALVSGLTLCVALFPSPAIGQPNFGGRSREPVRKPEQRPDAASHHHRTVSEISEDGPPLLKAASQEWRTYYTQRLIEARDASRYTNPRWDAQAKEFLELYAQWLSFEMPGRGRTELIDKGLKLRSAGCTDPLISCVMALMEIDLKLSGDARNRLRLAHPVLVNTSYPPEIIGLVTAQFAALSSPTGVNETRDVLVARASDLLLAALEQPGVTPSREAFLFRHIQGLLDDDWPINGVRGFCDRVKASASVPEWSKLMIAGTRHDREGWEARGGGFAGTVSDKDWHEFGVHLDAARESLEAAWKLRPDTPEAAALMIEVAKVGHGGADSARVWFERAIAAQFDHRPAYHSFRGSLLPRWGGSVEEMNEFGIECAACERYDTLVPYEAFNTLYSLCTNSENFVSTYTSGPLPTLVREVLQRYIEESLGGDDEGWFRSLLTFLEYRTGNWAAARAQLDNLDRLGELPTPAAHTNFRLLLPDVFCAVYPRTTPAIEAQILAADRAEEAGDWVAAVGRLEEALAAVPTPSPHARLHTALMDRLAFARVQRGLDSGEWTPLPVEKGLPGWRPVQGSWEVDADGTLVGKVASSGGMKILFGTPIGDRWELSAKVNLDAISPPSGRIAGPIFCHDWYSRPEGRFFAFMARPTSSTGTISRGIDTTRTGTIDKFTGPALLELSYDAGDITASINGRLVYRGEAPVGSWSPGEILGFAVSERGTGGRLKVSEIRLRKLSENEPQ